MADPLVAVRLLRAGHVLTEAGGDAGPADALALAGGVVAAAGSLADLRDRWPGAPVVDLGGTWVAPALDDAHCHPTIAADELCHVSLAAEQQRDLAVVAGSIAAAAPSNGWKKVVGWLESRVGGAPVDRAMLDALCPQGPLVVVHANGHWGYLNTAGLQRMGLVDAAGRVLADQVPANGWVAADSSGVATGQVYEQVLFDVIEPALARDQRQVALASFEDRLQALRRIYRRYLSRGVTSLTEALCSATGWELMAALAHEPEAPRCYALSPVVDVELARRLRDSPLERLSLLGLKSFVDGALNGGTCLQTDPAAGTEPQQLRDAGQVAQELRLAASLGLVLGVHANGDGAVDVLLAASARTGLAGRVEHGSLVRDDQLDGLQRYGWSVVPFGSYIREHGDRLAQTYGPQRMAQVVRHRSLLAAGIAVGGSSDYPCADLEPWDGLWSCVSRASVTGQVWGAQESLTPEQALRLYTRGSAQVRAGSGLAGTLLPGAPADLMVLEVDPLTPDGLQAMLGREVRATYLAGEPVFEAGDVPAITVSSS